MRKILLLSTFFALFAFNNVKADIVIKGQRSKTGTALGTIIVTCTGSEGVCATIKTPEVSGIGYAEISSGVSSKGKQRIYFTEFETNQSVSEDSQVTTELLFRMEK